MLFKVLKLLRRSTYWPTWNFYQTSNQVYERLDELGADTAEAKASHLLKGLGFNTAMQNKKCKDYSGGWRMRIGKKYLIYSNLESKNLRILFFTSAENRYNKE